eukprot:gnl/TRDRNA2_/TRDRNA2_199970_c0_seq1.p1 gnl/TRDRNA2_/TRDRNA2_199970_c0~~gnl/TRDRNA2_/TRDRNA2_199970_c0_seq1.p1  ORF type:complete len:294 (-),score=87.29 gnl/TRDRNA2_/TRDRNA2_199970_c0_seq1:58-939(-)
MELNEAHTAQIQRFMAFFKGKNERLIRDLASLEDDYKSDRLMDDQAIYNKGDAEVLVDGLRDQMLTTINEQLHNTVNLTAVYMSQLMAQAESVNFILQVDDISVIEDVSRTDQVSALAALPQQPLQPRKQATLTAIRAAYNNDPAVVGELQEMKEQNRQMMDRYQLMQTEVSSLLQERSALSTELEKVKNNFKNMKLQLSQSEPNAAAHPGLGEFEAALNESQSLLDEKSAQCEQMRRELNARLGDSTQFRDLKALVKKKSDEVKTLRQVLMAHGIGLPQDQNEGVELEPEDD